MRVHHTLMMSALEAAYKQVVTDEFKKVVAAPQSRRVSQYAEFCAAMELLEEVYDHITDICNNS